MRMRARLLTLPVAALLCCACVSVGGGDAPGRTWYRLTDRGVGVAAPATVSATTTGTTATSPTTTAGIGAATAATADPGARIGATLLVEGAAQGSLYESTALVFSRAPGAHAYYQFASWTEPPARRIAQLTVQRLAARERFDAVARIDAGIRGDLLLRVTVEEMLHELGAQGGRVRIGVTAELIDWPRRALIARRGFAANEPVGGDDAAAAVAAFDRGATRLLDGLAPWVEAVAASRAKR